MVYAVVLLIIGTILMAVSIFFFVKIYRIFSLDKRWFYFGEKSTGDVK
jgi:hypothetical protein